MSKPIIVEAWKHKEEEALFREEWTYEKILSIWDKESLELVPQLVHRCQKYEKRLEEIVKAWNYYKACLIAKYPIVGKRQWRLAGATQKIDKLCEEEL